MNPRIRVLFVLLAVLHWRSDAIACSCFDNPPCSGFWKADVVFVGHLVHDELIVKGKGSTGTISTLMVERVFRGTVAGDTIPIRQSHSSCAYTFASGRKYLVYAYQGQDGALTTDRCAGTKPFEEAEQEIATIQSLVTHAPYGRVYGKVERVRPGRLNTRDTKTEPAANITVALIASATRLEAATDPEGQFEITTVPPGKYEVQAVVPASVKVYQERGQIDVAARGCAPVHISIQSNGRVTGRLALPDGTPVARTFVSLRQEEIQTDEERRNAPSYTSGSDADGRFTIDGVPPGRYYLGVNLEFGPDLLRPYLATYYPGVTDKQSAQLIELAEGELKSGYDLTVTPLHETTLSGVVLDLSDAPVPGVSVTVAPVEHPFSYSGSVKTDASGAFSLKVLKGQTYVVSARTYPFTSEAKAAVTVTDEPQHLRLLLVPKSEK